MALGQRPLMDKMNRKMLQRMLKRVKNWELQLVFHWHLRICRLMMGRLWRNKGLAYRHLLTDRAYMINLIWSKLLSCNRISPYQSSKFRNQIQCSKMLRRQANSTRLKSKYTVNMPSISINSSQCYKISSMWLPSWELYRVWRICSLKYRSKSNKSCCRSRNYSWTTRW